MSGKCPETYPENVRTNVWEMSGNVQKISGTNQENDREMTGKSSENVQKMSGKVDRFTPKVNS